MKLVLYIACALALLGAGYLAVTRGPRWLDAFVRRYVDRDAPPSAADLERVGASVLGGGAWTVQIPGARPLLDVRGAIDGADFRLELPAETRAAIERMELGA